MTTDMLVIAGLMFALMGAWLLASHQILLMWTSLRLRRADLREALALARVAELEAKVKAIAANGAVKAAEGAAALEAAKCALELTALTVSIREQEALAAKHTAAIKEAEAAASLSARLNDEKVKGEQARQAAALEIERTALRRKHGAEVPNWHYSGDQWQQRVTLTVGEYQEQCHVLFGTRTTDVYRDNQAVNETRDAMMKRYLAFKNGTRA